MNNFNKHYIKLLREQVDVEIQYLIQNGHDSDKIYQPCMFCYDTQKGYHRCNRLTELKQFQSQLAVWKKGINEIECIQSSKTAIRAF